MKPHPRSYGVPLKTGPLNVGIPNVKHQGHTDPENVFSWEREREEQRRQIAEAQRVIYNRRPGLFVNWRAMRRTLGWWGLAAIIVGALLFWALMWIRAIDIPSLW